jgi:hypothetical protein
LKDNNLNLSDFDFVFIDSINHMKMKLDEYKKIRKDNKNLACVLILQTTKGNNFKGGKDWTHEVEVNAKLMIDRKTGKRCIDFEKCRYEGSRTIDI